MGPLFVSRPTEAEPMGMVQLTSRFFEVLSRVRGKRIFHPHGIGFRATFQPAEEAGAAFRPLAQGSREAIVRVSRGLGLPEPLPDFFGFAVRLPDVHGAGRHQDFLLASGSARPVLRHIVLPTFGLGCRSFTSLAPYVLDDRKVVVVAIADPGTPRLDLGTLRSQGAADTVVRLGFATSAGPWEHVADIVLHDRLPVGETEPIGFNPVHTGGGLELAGLINRVRLPAYVGSQKGRRCAQR